MLKLIFREDEIWKCYMTGFLNENFQQIKAFEFIETICIAKINVDFAHVHHHLAYFKVTLRASKRQLFF